MRLAHSRMIGRECCWCGDAVFPPRPVCPQCSIHPSIEGVRWEELALRMRLESARFETEPKVG